MATRKQSKKLCNIGVIRKAVSPCVAHWKRERKKEDNKPLGAGIKASATASYVSSLPPPPNYGTPEYQHCIMYWYMAYMLASMMDSRLQQIQSLQTQNATDQVTLNTRITEYGNCMIGPWV